MCNIAVRPLPKKNPKVKSYFQLHTPEGSSNKFVKHAYQLLTATCCPKGAVLIHYIGDENCTTEFPHGNASNSIATQPKNCALFHKTMKLST